MRHVIRAAAALLISFGCAPKEQVTVPDVVLDTTAYVEPPAFGTYPSPKEVINGWIAAGDTVKIRRHAWDIWAALTAPSGHGDLPVWETFYSGHEIFELDSTDASQPLRHLRDFEVPEQHEHVRRIAARGHAIPLTWTSGGPHSIAFPGRRPNTSPGTG